MSIVLETPRLRLRTIGSDDAAFILEVLNEPAFIANVADRGVRTVNDAENYIAEKIIPSYEKHGFGFYIVELRESGVAVGMCGLIKRDFLDDVDIGYSVLERFWRNGYAYEAAEALMRHGRNVFSLPRIVGFTSLHNGGSQALLEKLGLRHVKTVQLPGFKAESMYFA